MPQSSKRAREPEDDMLGKEVSDGGSSCSGDLSDVDELLSINGTDEEPENETEVIIANRQCIEGVDVLLAHEYGPEPPRKTLPQCLPSWWRLPIAG